MVHAADLIRLPMPLQGRPGPGAHAAATPARSRHPLDAEGLAWLDRVAHPHAHPPSLQLEPPHIPAPPRPTVQLQPRPGTKFWNVPLAGGHLDIGPYTGVALVVLGSAMLYVLMRAARRAGRRLGLPRIRVQQPTPQPELGMPGHPHDIALERLSPDRAPRQAAAPAPPRAGPRASEPWPGSHRPQAA
jgi:hypothetical protein